MCGNTAMLILQHIHPLSCPEARCRSLLGSGIHPKLHFVNRRAVMLQHTLLGKDEMKILLKAVCSLAVLLLKVSNVGQPGEGWSVWAVASMVFLDLRFQSRSDHPSSRLWPPGVLHGIGWRISAKVHKARPTTKHRKVNGNASPNGLTYEERHEEPFVHYEVLRRALSGHR